MSRPPPGKTTSRKSQTTSIAARLRKRIERQRHVDLGLHTAPFHDISAPRVPSGDGEPNNSDDLPLH